MGTREAYPRTARMNHARSGYGRSVDQLLEVEVPAQVESLRIVRLVTLDAAERARMDCDWADDLRIGVEELCLGVLPLVPRAEGTLWLRFWVDEGSVVVHGVVRGARHHPGAGSELGSTALAILAAVADDFEITTSDTCERFVLVKRSVAIEAVAS
jgi:hypothetical protein